MARPARRAAARLPGLSAAGAAGIVYASARFDPDYADVFGFDMLRKADILPVAVTVVLRGPDQDQAQVLLKPEQWNPQLYLQDGTALAAMSVQEVADLTPERLSGRVREQALRGGLLSSKSEEQYLFFRLDPEAGLDVDGWRVRSEHDGVVRELDLAASLLSFQVTIAGAPVPFYVGIQR
jgi:hypothetical protein